MTQSVMDERTYDLYPSRCALEAQLLERQDPTVYAPQDTQGPLTDSAVRAYAEQGFLILEDLFTGEELAALQTEQTRLRNVSATDHPAETISEQGSGDMRSVFQVHLLSTVFQKLSSDPRLADIARYLLDDDVYIHQSRLNYKPGFRGKEFYWHSDFETWHVEDGMPRMRALSMSITLTDNHNFNGPLMLVPGSHMKYSVCEGETPDNHYKKSLKKQDYGVPSDALLSELIDSSEIIAATGKPGSVIIFDCNLMHGSNGNITPYPRSNVFFVYNAISNQVGSPFCDQPPRPEHICTRRNIRPIAR